MSEKTLTRLWGISLIVIGVGSLVILVPGLFGVTVPDSVIGALGILELIALPVLAFTTVKRMKK